MNYRKLGIPHVLSPDLQPLYNISGQINSGNEATPNLNFNTLSVNSASIWSNNENLFISTGGQEFFNTGVFNQTIPVRSIGDVSRTGIITGFYFSGWNNSGTSLRYFIKLDKGSPVTISISGTGRFYTPIVWVSSSSITGKLNRFDLFSGNIKTGSFGSPQSALASGFNRFSGTLPITDEYLFLTGNPLNSTSFITSNNIFINVNGNFGYYPGLKSVSSETEWPKPCEYFGGFIANFETNNEVLETGVNYFNLLNSIGNLNTGQAMTGLVSTNLYTFRCLRKDITGNVTQTLGGINDNSKPLISGIFGYGKSGFTMFLNASYDGYFYNIYSSGSGNGTLDKFTDELKSLFYLDTDDKNQNETFNSTISVVPPPNNY